MKKIAAIFFLVCGHSIFCAEESIVLKSITLHTLGILQGRVKDTGLDDFLNETQFLKQVAGQTMQPASLGMSFMIEWKRYMEKVSDEDDTSEYDIKQLEKSKAVFLAALLRGKPDALRLCKMMSY